MAGLELMGKIGLDGRAFEAELSKANHLAKGIAQGITTGLKHAVLAGVGIATVEQAISKTVESVNELVDASKRLGIAPEQLQVLKQAAKQSGVELDQLASAFEKIDIAREKALIPGAEGSRARRAFGALGIGGDMLHNMTAANLFTGPMAAAVHNTNPEQLGIAFREMGIKGFGPLIAVMRTDFDRLGKHMHQFGSIIDSESIAKIKLLGNEFSLISNIVVAHLAPAILKVVDVILHAIAGLSSAWASIKSFFTDKPANDAMQSVMGATPGFGGYTPSQKEFIAKGGVKHTTPAQDSIRRKFAIQAGAEKMSEWDKFLGELQNRLLAYQFELNHPHAADFDRSTLPEKMSPKALLSPTDNLVKVGNFLGGRGLGLQFTQVQLLQQIANNTASMARLKGSVNRTITAGSWRTDALAGTSFPHR